MTEARVLVEKAFQTLRSRPGFTDREFQYQLALLMFDLIEDGTMGAIEAPTGIGKSLACLIPAIAHALTGKKVVIATYTNILAEQYAQKDLPFALSLFEEKLIPEPAFLVGRQRYVCLSALRETTQGSNPVNPTSFDAPRRAVVECEYGMEKEFKTVFQRAGITQQKVNKLWTASVTPPACAGRMCPDYSACFYYRMRDAAQKSNLIITNHSVVIQDCLMKQNQDEESEQDSAGLIGFPDAILLDEAHDFPQAAMSGLEFTLDIHKVEQLKSAAARIDHQLAVASANFPAQLRKFPAKKRLDDALAAVQSELSLLNPSVNHGVALASEPGEWLEHPALKERTNRMVEAACSRIADSVQTACKLFLKEVDDKIEGWVQEGASTDGDAKRLSALILNQTLFMKQISKGCQSFASPPAGDLSWVASEPDGTGHFSACLRCDVVDLAPQLKELLWHRVPVITISATLAIDGAFDFFEGLTGFKGSFEEILPSPFDFPNQAALYLPKEGSVPDPSQSRGEGQVVYYQSLAREIGQIIRAMEGRTLVLFHSRKEMEEVYKLMDLPPELSLLIQPRTSASIVGQAFKDNISSSLFAVRSFWTGFDAPGETLSCVVLTRIPFEVPVVPSQIARSVMLSLEGKDPFQYHSLSQAKMMIRQGSGRLIRNESDFGLICLLDPRVKTKRYGESILENLPPGLKCIRDPMDWSPPTS